MAIGARTVLTTPTVVLHTHRRSRLSRGMAVSIHRSVRTSYCVYRTTTATLSVSCFVIGDKKSRSSCWKMARPTQSSSNQNSGSSHPYNVDISGMRIRYKDKSETFTEDHLVSKEPFGQFKHWFEIACNTPGIGEANAVFLGTATKEGIPSVRPVLMKGFGTDGFKFYTNYGSRKARELEENPNAALTFFWEPLRRTVRIEGTVKKSSAEDSDQYFSSRPYYGQIGSLSSRQSTIIPSRDCLIEKEKELQKIYTEDKVPRPEWWGGYIVIPHTVEFWQGQSDRLHDRIRFRRLKSDEKPDNILVHEGADGWIYERLSP